MVIMESAKETAMHVKRSLSTLWPLYLFQTRCLTRPEYPVVSDITVSRVATRRRSFFLHFLYVVGLPSTNCRVGRSNLSGALGRSHSVGRRIRAGESSEAVVSAASTRLNSKLFGNGFSSFVFICREP